MVLHSRFKTKQLLRSDVDRSTDQQNDRSIDKMTTVTLWRMRALKVNEGPTDDCDTVGGLFALVVGKAGEEKDSLNSRKCSLTD